MKVWTRQKLKLPFITLITVLCLFSFAYVTFSPRFGKHFRRESSRLLNRVNSTRVDIAYKKYTYLEKRSLENVKDFSPLSNFSGGSKYTIVIPTYHRTSLIKRAVKHYSNFKNISKIIVVWFNEEKMPTNKEISEYVNEKTRISLEFYWMPNYVRLRYFPYPTIDTEAVLNVDDDILVEENSALRAFKHWKNERNLMYGFISRSHNEISRNLYEYVMRETVPYSFLLANNVFLHRKFYKIYQKYIKEWENSIDRWQACEDIAMSFMIADLSKRNDCANKVNGKITDIRETGRYRGLSKRIGHHFQRSYCLNRFSERYANFPLKKHSNILK